MNKLSALNLLVIRKVKGSNRKLYFSVVDVISQVRNCDYDIARNYWKVTKRRLKARDFDFIRDIVKHRLTAKDGKKHNTDVATLKTMLKIIVSIPPQRITTVKRYIDFNIEDGLNANSEVRDV